MARTILAVLAGLLVMGILVGAIEALNYTLYPGAANLALNQGEDGARILEALPLGAKLVVIAAWAFGALLGALVAAFISKQHKRGAALVIAAAMLASTLYVLATIPHPLWMVALGVLMPVPLALLAWWLVRPAPAKA